jgi:hypothetical protein
MWEKINVWRVLVGKPDGRKRLGKFRRRWEDNTEMILQKWDGEAWTGMIWLSIGTRDGHVKSRQGTFGSCKVRKFLD